MGGKDVRCRRRFSGRCTLCPVCNSLQERDVAAEVGEDNPPSPLAPPDPPEIDAEVAGNFSNRRGGCRRKGVRRRQNAGQHEGAIFDGMLRHSNRRVRRTDQRPGRSNGNFRLLDLFTLMAHDRFGCTPLVQRDDKLADLDQVPFLHVNFCYRPGGRRRDRCHRLVAFQLEHRLVFVDFVANVYEDARNGSGISAFSKSWEFDFHA